MSNVEGGADADTPPERLPDGVGLRSGQADAPATHRGEEITDVVAWLAAQRPRFPGRPYPSPSLGSATRAIP